MLTPTQIEKIRAIDNPLIRERYIKFYQLADNLRATIFSEETSDKIWKIGKEQNKFSDEQLRWLAYYAGLVLLGEVAPSDLAKKIQENCGVDEMTAKNIVQEIAKEIFVPVKESLKKLHGLPSEVLTKEGLSGITPEIPAKEELPKTPPISPPDRPAAPPSATYREPIESTSPIQAKLEREILVPPSNIVDLKNLS